MHEASTLFFVFLDNGTLSTTTFYELPIAFTRGLGRAVRDGTSVAPSASSLRARQPGARPHFLLAPMRTLPFHSHVAAPLLWVGLLLPGARASWMRRAQAARLVRAAVALQARERRRCLAVHDRDDGLLHLDPIRDRAGCVIDFVVTAANARAATLLRRPIDEVVGERTSTLAGAGHDTAHFHTLVNTLRTGAIHRAEVRVHPRHVATSWLLVRAVRVDGGLALALTDIRDRKREFRGLRRASRTDPLTGLVNRRGFLEHAEQALGRARATGSECLLLSMDCDAFRAINDTCGHAVGDRTLVEIGKALSSSVRDTDLVARIGNDEFAILARDTTGDCTDAIRARIQERLDALNRSQRLPMPVSVSIGHMPVPAHETRPLAALLAAADEEIAHRQRARRAARTAKATIARATALRAQGTRAGNGRTAPEPPEEARPTLAHQLTGVPSLA
jgi:diguanylate cyclase (GGDEF)-like protein